MSTEKSPAEQAVTKRGFPEVVNDAPGFRGIVFVWRVVGVERRSESECGPQARSAEHVHHAFQVVGDGRQTDLGLRSAASAQQEPRVPEDAVLQGSEGMFDRRSSQPHGFGSGPLLHSLQRAVVKMALHEAAWTDGTVRLQGTSGAGFRRCGIADRLIFAMQLFAQQSLASGTAEGVGLVVVDKPAAIEQRAIAFIVDTSIGRNMGTMPSASQASACSPFE